MESLDLLEKTVNEENCVSLKKVMVFSEMKAFYPDVGECSSHKWIET